VFVNRHHQLPDDDPRADAIPLRHVGGHPSSSLTSSSAGSVQSGSGSGGGSPSLRNAPRPGRQAQPPPVVPRRPGAGVRIAGANAVNGSMVRENN
jgi:hypothetical protein